MPDSSSSDLQSPKPLILLQHRGNPSLSIAIMELQDRTSSMLRYVGDFGTSNPHFLSLPFEIRLLIYELVVKSTRCCQWHDCTVSPRPPSLGYLWDTCESERQPPLAATCRQVRAELLPVYYGKNYLMVDDFRQPGKARRWRDTVGEHNLSFITGIVTSAEIQLPSTFPATEKFRIKFRLTRVQNCIRVETTFPCHAGAPALKRALKTEIETFFKVKCELSRDPKCLNGLTLMSFAEVLTQDVVSKRLKLPPRVFILDGRECFEETYLYSRTTLPKTEQAAIVG